VTWDSSKGESSGEQGGEKMRHEVLEKSRRSYGYLQ